MMLIHEILPVGPLQCNCSVIGDPKTREAMVVDPGDEVERILEVIVCHRLQVKQIVVTHGHIDHVAGAMKLKRAIGAPILMHEQDLSQLKHLPAMAAWIGVPVPEKVEVDASPAEGDVLLAGPLEARVLHTPGHTEGSICLYLPRPQKLIAGDTLFAGSIGRTDLPGGSSRKLINSIHERLLALPDETMVVPGHGDLTTIGQERETNPFLLGRFPL